MDNIKNAKLVEQTNKSATVAWQDEKGNLGTLKMVQEPTGYYVISGASSLSAKQVKQAFKLCE